MSCSDDKTVRIWGTTRVKQPPDSDQVAISGEVTVLEGHRNPVVGVSWSPVKLASGHELVATYVVIWHVPPLTPEHVQCIIRHYGAALGC